MTDLQLPPLSPEQERIKAELAKFTITGGSHTDEEYREGFACILEAFRLVLGLPIENTSSEEELAPPCMSNSIAGILMDINDEVDAEKGMTEVHQALLEVAPFMLSTAATTSHTDGRYIWTVKNEFNLDYVRAEAIREDLHREWVQANRKKAQRHYFTTNRLIFRKKNVLEHLLKLADVAYFKDGVVIWGKGHRP